MAESKAETKVEEVKVEGEGEKRERRDSRPPRGERKVLEEKCTGTVKWFNVRKGYGFIARNDEKKDVFVHRTSIPFRYVLKSNKRHTVRSLGDNEAVEFSVVEGRNGEEAWSVTGPDGAKLQGSEYAPLKYPYRRRRKSKTGSDAEEGEAKPPRRRGSRKAVSKDSAKEKDTDSAKEEGGKGDEAGKRERRRPRTYGRGRRGEPKAGEGDADTKTDDEGAAAKPQRRRHQRRPKTEGQKSEGEGEGERGSDAGRRKTASGSEAEDDKLHSNTGGGSIVKKMVQKLVNQAASATSD